MLPTVPRWSHSKPEVRRALDEASAAGLKVEPTPDSHGHSWGYIDCTDLDCGLPRRRFYVNSTPGSPSNHANDIRRFMKRHQHKKGTGGRPRQ